MKPVLVVQNIESEDSGVFGERMRELGVETETVRPYQGGEIPATVDSYSAVLIMGGPMNVDQAGRYPFLEGEKRLVCACRSSGTPLLGICLGSQVIADALGAPVYDSGTVEIGWYGLCLTAEATRDPLFAGLGPEMTVFQWHAQTFDVPGCGVLLAESGGVANQAFRADDTIWGLQFHLETTEKHIRRWLEENRDYVAGLEHIRPDEIIRRIPEYEKKCRETARTMITRFCGIARELEDS